MSAKRIAVAGGGPAGMLAAIKAAERGAEVILLEKMERPGKKMMITGKGRCNITNVADVQEIIKNIPGNGSFLNSSLRFFGNGDVIALFNSLGVATKVERGGRVFPESDRASDAVDALIAKMRALGVDIRTGARVTGILTEGGRARGLTLEGGDTVASDAVILAAGGASYPKTGSNGDGAELARSLGHTIEPLCPALVPLTVDEDWARELSGLSLKNVRVTLAYEGKKLAEDFGEMMFAHFGVTGPIILSVSRAASVWFARGGAPLDLVVNLKPALTAEKLYDRIRRDFDSYSGKSVKNAMKELLPHRLIDITLDLAYIDPDKKTGQATREERLRLVRAIQRLTLTIPRARPITEAIVTAGGVSTKEIDPKTMASKLVRGLYFAGEVVDVDGLTGGYNLQAAFSMGAAAGAHAAGT